MSIGAVVAGEVGGGGVAALVGGGLIQAIRSGRETKRRRESPLQFDSQLSQQDFIEIVDRIAKTTPRVTRAVTTGLITVLHVRSNSGLTNWTAEVDFNDYGRPTGRYWITSENTQSPIPEVFEGARGGGQAASRLDDASRWVAQGDPHADVRCPIAIRSF